MPDPTAHMTPKARDAYAKAQQLIRECQASGDTDLYLSGLGLTGRFQPAAACPCT